jgi:transposase
MRFHIDACQPRHPEGKGKVERGIRDNRDALDPYGQEFDSIEDLQAWTDARLDDRARHLRCPATGTSVADAWEQEHPLLTPR